MVARLLFMIAAFVVRQHVEQPPKYIIRFFEHRSHVYVASDGTRVEIPYALYAPRSLTSHRKYTLLVALHGAGQQGTDNTAQLRHFDETIMPNERNNDYPLFVLAPQCYRNLEWSTQEPGTMKPVKPGVTGKDMLDITCDLIDQLVADCPIDPNRIVLMGLSSGGTAAWELAGRYPKKFAAVMPFGSSPTANLDLDKLRQVKIWAFHSPLDRSVSPAAVQNLVSHLNGVGAVVTLSYSCDNESLDDEAMNHYCFGSAFEEYDLTSWILTQTRDGYSPNPGVIAWSNRFRWVYLRPRVINSVPYLVVTAVVLATVTEIRRRNAIRQKSAETVFHDS